MEKKENEIRECLLSDLHNIVNSYWGSEGSLEYEFLGDCILLGGQYCLPVFSRCLIAPESHCFVNFVSSVWVSVDGNINLLELYRRSEDKLPVGSATSLRHQDTCERSTVATALLECQHSSHKPSDDILEKNYFLFHFFLETTSSALHGFGLPPHCFYSLLTTALPILFGMF